MATSIEHVMDVRLPCHFELWLANQPELATKPINEPSDGVPDEWQDVAPEIRRAGSIKLSVVVSTSLVVMVAE